MWESPHLNMKNELLVCIYEISGDLIFKYGIFGCMAQYGIVNHTHPNIPKFS